MNDETATANTATQAAAYNRYADIAVKVDRETAEKINPYISESTIDTLNRVRHGLEMLGQLCGLDTSEINMEKWYWGIGAMSGALAYESDAIRRSRHESRAARST